MIGLRASWQGVLLGAVLSFVLYICHLLTLAPLLAAMVPATAPSGVLASALFLLMFFLRFVTGYLVARRHQAQFGDDRLVNYVLTAAIGASVAWLGYAALGLLGGGIRGAVGPWALLELVVWILEMGAGALVAGLGMSTSRGDDTGVLR